jgi:SAM-dependent methyltransferase
LNDPFLQPSAAPAHIDRFLPRQSILDALRRHAPHFRGVCLDVGCGDMPYRSLLLSPPFQITSYIGLDRPGDRFQNTQPDLFWDNERIPLATATVDCALCTEVLEHCPNPLELLQEVQRVLKPGGSLILTVPFLWPLHEVPYDWCRFTPFALQHLLEVAGFQVDDLRSLGGYDRCLAQMLALWVRRRPMNRWLRVGLTFLAYPLWTALRLSCEPAELGFAEGQMITGLVVRAERLHALMP